MIKEKKRHVLERDLSRKMRREYDIYITVPPQTDFAFRKRGALLALVSRCSLTPVVVALGLALALAGLWRVLQSVCVLAGVCLCVCDGA